MNAAAREFTARPAVRTRIDSNSDTRVLARPLTARLS